LTSSNAVTYIVSLTCDQCNQTCTCIISMFEKLFLKLSM